MCASFARVWQLLISLIKFKWFGFAQRAFLRELAAASGAKVKVVHAQRVLGEQVLKVHEVDELEEDEEGPTVDGDHLQALLRRQAAMEDELREIKTLLKSALERK